MAADTPFGLSFGNPSKYMGQSPLSDVGKALKTGLIGYGIQESGLEKWLNDKGMKKKAQGGYEYNAPVGAAVPDGVAKQPISPNALSAIPSAVAPNQMAPTPTTPAPMSFPPNLGGKILDGDWDGIDNSSVDPQAQRDSLVLPQQVGYNQMLQTGNEFQQMPGYGKLAKAFQTFAGGMG